jgi:hypothetical protein
MKNVAREILARALHFLKELAIEKPCRNQPALEVSAVEQLTEVKEPSFGELINRARILRFEDPRRPYLEQEIIRALMPHVQNSLEAQRIMREFPFLSGRRRFIRTWIAYTWIGKKSTVRILYRCVDDPGYESAMAELLIKTPRWLRPVLEEMRNGDYNPFEEIGNRIAHLTKVFEDNPILLKPGFEDVANEVAREIMTGAA